MPVPIAVVGAGVVGAIKTGGELAAAIKAMADVVPKAADALQDKFRWMTVSIRNETQFRLIYMSDHFDSGRFWDAPEGIVLPFSTMVFSVCSKDGSIGTGCSGGVRLKVDIDEPLYIGVGFANPAVGSKKASVDFRREPGAVAREAAEAADDRSMRDTSRTLTGQNKHGETVEYQLEAVSSPAQNARITITQKLV
jgi:hypothetical protein